MRYLLLTALFAATLSRAEFDIQAAVNKAASGATITIPAGIYTEPLIITKKITLSGKGPETVFRIEANQPAFLVETAQPVLIENLQIQHKITAQADQVNAPFAVYSTKGKLSVKNCVFKALGTPEESPAAAVIMGNGSMYLENCMFDGFNFTVQFGSGSKGSVENCLIKNPGHCGITIGENASVSLKRNIVTGSLFHGIRCTGGEITAEENLVAKNKSRGFYIGNKSVTGKLSNNLIVDNGVGIQIFARSVMDIENNVIFRSSHAGLSIIDSATLTIEDNIISENETGILGFSDIRGREPRIEIANRNILIRNTAGTESVVISSETLIIDPKFKNPEAGLFETTVKEAKGIGLKNPSAMQVLWGKWQTESGQ